MDSREPNAAHNSVAHLETSGHVDAVITQNVDGLHQRAGSRRVLELHGTLSEVVCLNCGSAEPRRAFQTRLSALNPGWEAPSAKLAPDGDAEIPSAVADGFVVPSCTICRGTVKPNVVLFGDSVPRRTVERAFEMVSSAHALLVLGSSLAVFSGYRFVKRATELGIPVAIVNQGPTRGDSVATIRIDAPLEEVMPELVGFVEQR
jgi:NAD-dependent protein deacetylase/lipoamidase sirtuin 4